MGAAVVVCMRSSSVCEVNELHCKLVSFNVWVGDGDTCCASTRGTERVMIWVMVRYVYEILKRDLFHLVL
jgi:hypothetical protein